MHQSFFLILLSDARKRYDFFFVFFLFLFLKHPFCYCINGLIANNVVTYFFFFFHSMELIFKGKMYVLTKRFGRQSFFFLFSSFLNISNIAIVLNVKSLIKSPLFSLLLLVN